MAYLITQIELAQPLGAIAVPADHTGVALIVRRGGRPVGFVMEELPAGGRLAPDEIQRLLEARIKPYLLNGDDAATEPHATVPRSLTVAICTRDHPDDLARCLGSLERQRSAGWPFQILVVDNAPSTDATARLAAARPEVRYILEPMPGLNFARNRAVAEADTEMLAFIDDDVTVDPHWLDGLRHAVTAHPDAGAVTGLVLPAELATPAQVLFEKRGGFEKKFDTIRYGATLPGHPFYPCVGGKFGTGCNMAFQRKVLLELGGFDEALDTGPPLPGGGDTDMLYRVVRAGHPLVYEPRFLLFHRHRREIDALRRQYSRSWGQGLMAFVAKSYGSDPEQRSNLRRLVRWWFGNELRELYDSLRGRHVLPPDMLWAELCGGILGILGAYPRSRRLIERIRRQYSAAMSARGSTAARPTALR